KESGVIYLSNMPEGTSNYWCINNGIITTPPDDDGIEVTWQQAGTGELILTQVVDSSGCAAETVPYLVTVNDKPEVLVSAPEITACEGDRVEVTAQGAVQYEWFPADGLAAPLEAEISFKAKESMIYQVIGTNDFYCKDTATVKVNVVLLPVVDLGEDTYIRENESIELFAGEGYAYYEWQDGSTLPSFTACNPGIYFVYVENQGCFVYDTITISPTLGAIPIPTAFTPNADGLNDEFRLFGRLEKVEQFSMKIYSRNGQLLFETTDVFSGWKGENLQGQPVPAGTYIYRIDLFEQGNPFNQGMITRQGVVTLLR
ncbi:MAG: gliding motility-associated C-terminal domain-containing protein, partial [Syntrophomonadaceae bacterium]